MVYDPVAALLNELNVTTAVTSRDAPRWIRVGHRQRQPLSIPLLPLPRIQHSDPMALTSSLHCWVLRADGGLGVPVSHHVLKQASN